MAGTYDTSDRYALRALLGSSNVSDIDEGFDFLRDDVSALLTPFYAGARASRPISTPGTPGIAGRQYMSTGDGGIDVDTGTAWVTVRPGLFTSLPTLSGHAGDGLDDGMLIHYVANATRGIIWPLRYRAGSADARKWEAVGQPTPKTGAQGAATSNVTAGLTSFATIGNSPAINNPLAGHYRISLAGSVQASAAGEIRLSVARIPSGGGGPFTIGPTTGFVGLGANAGAVVSLDFDTEDFGSLALSASDTLVIQMATSAVGFTTGNPAPFTMSLTPRRVA